MFDQYNLIKEILAATSEDLKRVTVQIWRQKSNEFGEFIISHASGVLLKHTNRFFLLTAAHIFIDEGQKIDKMNLLIRVKGEPLPLNGELLTPDDDKYDIAIIEFEPKIGDKISTSYRFLNLDEIQINHDIDILINRYIVFGFPCYKSEINDSKKRVESSGFATVTSLISEKKFAEQKLDEYINLGLKLDTTTIDLKDMNKKKIPPLNGVSGSGLWLVSTTSDGKLEKKLVGIMSAHDNRRNCLTYMRIEIITELLREFCEVEGISPALFEPIYNKISKP